MKTFAMSLVVGLCAAPALAQQSIEQIAPENSVLIFGAPNVQLTRDRFERTPLYDLWQSEEFQAMCDDGSFEAFEKFMDELGVDRDELTLPSGAIGFALYPVIDPEIGRPSAAMMAFADYGATADAIGALVLSMLDRGERERVLEFETKDILGRTVYEIRRVDDDNDPFDDDDFDPFGMMPSPDDLLEDIEQVFYVRDNNRFLLCTDLGSLTEALDRIDGNVRGTVADRDDFKALMGQVGRDDFYVAFLTRDLMQLVMAGDEMGMMQMMSPTFKALFGDIRGIGMSARMDGDDAMLEGRWSVYMPSGKSGLPRLFDLSGPRGEVPSFVGPDAVTFSAMNVRFDQVVPVLRTIIQSNPILAMQAQEMMPTLEGPVADVLATLGTSVHSWTTITRPLTAESVGTAFAIEAREQQEFENLIAEFAPEIGLEPRDFLGQRIYSADMGGMFGPGEATFSLGIGGGQIFLGSNESVEQALRTVAQPGEALTLADDPSFRNAVSKLSQRQIVSWSYSNFVEIAAVMQEVSRLQHEQWMEAMKEWRNELDMDDDDWDDDWMDDWDDDDDMDWDLIRRYVGPFIGEVRSTDDGFVGSIFLISPAR